MVRVYLLRDQSADELHCEESVIFFKLVPPQRGGGNLWSHDLLTCFVSSRSKLWILNDGLNLTHGSIKILNLMNIMCSLDMMLWCLLTAQRCFKNSFISAAPL